MLEDSIELRYNLFWVQGVNEKSRPQKENHQKIQNGGNDSVKHFQRANPVSSTIKPRFHRLAPLPSRLQLTFADRNGEPFSAPVFWPWEQEKALRSTARTRHGP